MVGAIVFSPTDAASQKAVVGSAQRVLVAQNRRCPFSFSFISSNISVRKNACVDGVIRETLLLHYCCFVLYYSRLQTVHELLIQLLDILFNDIPKMVPVRFMFFLLLLIR